MRGLSPEYLEWGPQRPMWWPPREAVSAAEDEQEGTYWGHRTDNLLFGTLETRSWDEAAETQRNSQRCRNIINGLANTWRD